MLRLFAALVVCTILGEAALLAAPAPPAGDPLMHLCEPSDSAFAAPLPSPNIPPPPTNKGLLDRRKLRTAPALEFKGDAELAAEAAQPNGWVKGRGTAKDPYVIRDLRITGVTDKWGIQVHFMKAPLLIENCLVEGAPPSPLAPASGFGISVIDSQAVTIRHCEVSKCFGIYGGGSALRNLLVEDCHVFSASHGIMTSNGAFCTARGNYVHDCTKYGVFLYAGTDHVTENNYVAWTGREGTGTNGNAHRHKYLNNVILHSGWTAINVEGANDDTLVEGNLVVNSHYAIILGGARTICRKNRVFYGSQAGLWVFNSPEGLLIEDNLVVGGGSCGIDVTGDCQGATVRRNRVLGASTGINVGGPDALIEGNEISRFYWGLTQGPPGRGIRDNRFYLGRYSLSLNGQGAGFEVTGNLFSHNLSGILAKDLTGVVLRNNRFDSPGMMMSFSKCTGLTIQGNQGSQLAYTGIQLGDCSNCTLEGNRLYGGVTEALRLTGGSANTVRGNLIGDIVSSFSGAGLILQNTADNVVAGNTFERCGVAVAFDGEKSTGNRLEGNTYTANGQPVALQNGADKIPETNALDTTAEVRK